MEKRRSLFTQYSFEIGVVTLPAYLVLIAFGLAYLASKAGIALVAVGAVGALSALASIAMGYKEIKW